MLQEKYKKKAIKIFVFLLMSLFLVSSGCKKEEEKSEIDLKREQREREWAESGQKMAAKEESEKVSVEADYGKKTDAQISAEPFRKMKIGVLGAETGELSEYGLKTLKGVQLAVEEVNASGGINGQPLELVHYDTFGTMSGAQSAVDGLIEEDVAAIIGSATNEVAFSSTKKLNDRQTILISAGTRRRIGDAGPYIYRTTLSDDDAVDEVVDYCINKLGIKKFALFSSLNNDYSITLTGLFKKHILNKGGEIVEDVFLWAETTAYISKEEASIESQIAKIKLKSPQVVVYTGDPIEGVKIAKEMRRQGINTPLIGGEDLYTDSFLKDGKDAVLGTIVYSGFFGYSNSPQTKKFVDLYTKKTGKTPDRIAALGYEALMIVAEALRKTESMRPTHIRDSLSGIRDFNGITGTVSFTENREVKKRAYIFKAERGGEKINFNLVGGEG
jgi:branched-chain amino acid transport system substrate-binding protein